MSELLAALGIAFALGFWSGITWAKIRSNQRWAKMLDDTAEEERLARKDEPP